MKRTPFSPGLPGKTGLYQTQPRLMSPRPQGFAASGKGYSTLTCSRHSLDMRHTQTFATPRQVQTAVNSECTSHKKQTTLKRDYSAASFKSSAAKAEQTTTAGFYSVERQTSVKALACTEEMNSIKRGMISNKNNVSSHK